MWTKYVGAKGTLWYRREGAVVESAVLGEMDEQNPALLTAELDRCYAEHGWCAAFHDWEQITTYTARARLDWLRWATTPAARAARFSQFRLGSSPMIRMVVSVASVTFSSQKFTIHETGVSFASARLEYMTRPERIPELGARRM